MSSIAQTTLRKACQAAGITGASKLSIDQMKAALIEKGAALPELPTKPAKAEKAPPAAKAEKPVKAKVEKAAKAPKPVKVKKAKAEGEKGAREGSVRDWLSQQGDRISVEAALKHAASIGRSQVTVYRQASELGFTARKEKGFFVKE
jgi:hypothetical protein